MRNKSRSYSKFSDNGVKTPDLCGIAERDKIFPL